MGLMTAFGEGFLMTPLELAGILSSIANGGTLYYLQYPRNEDEIEQFTPRVKRTLDIAPNGIEDIKVGMRGAVDYGTARRANYDPNELLFGKTGTCTDFRAGVHMGWFGSFTEVGSAPIGGDCDADQPCEIGEWPGGFRRGGRVLQESRGAALFCLAISPTAMRRSPEHRNRRCPRSCPVVRIVNSFVTRRVNRSDSVRPPLAGFVLTRLRCLSSVPCTPPTAKFPRWSSGPMTQSITRTRLPRPMPNCSATRCSSLGFFNNRGPACCSRKAHRDHRFVRAER